MLKKIEKNYVNIILNKIKVDLSNYLLCINTNFKNIKNNAESEALIISTYYCIQNIFFKLRNYICKFNFINYKNFKIFNFYFQRIKNKINKFLEEKEEFKI